MILNKPTPPASVFSLEAFIVAVPLKRLLHYLRHPRHQMPLHTSKLEPLQTDPLKNIREALHINLGTPEIEEPECPIEENLHVLETAIKKEWKTVPVLFSGQLERAVHAGLISGETLIQLRLHLMALPSLALDDE